ITRRRYSHSLFIELPCELKVSAKTILEVVVINEVISCVVWRIDEDELHAVVVGLLKELEHLKVVALDEDVLGCVKVHGALEVRNERTSAARQERSDSVLLASPHQAEALAFLGGDGYIDVDELAETAGVQDPVGDYARKEVFEGSAFLDRKVRRGKIDP